MKKVIKFFFILILFNACEKSESNRAQSAVDSLNHIVEEQSQQIKQYLKNEASLKEELEVLMVEQRKSAEQLSGLLERLQESNDRSATLTKQLKDAQQNATRLAPKDNSKEVRALTTKIALLEQEKMNYEGLLRENALKKDSLRLQISALNKVIDEQSNTSFDKPLKEEIKVFDTVFIEVQAPDSKPKNSYSGFEEVTSNEKEAFRLLILARDTLETNPTLAMAILKQASKITSDSIISAEANRVYDQYYFYKTIDQMDGEIETLEVSGQVINSLSSSKKLKGFFGRDSATAFSNGYLLDLNGYIRNAMDSIVLPSITKKGVTHFQMFEADSGQYCLLGLTNKKTFVFSLNGKKVGALIGHKYGITDAAVSSDGKYVVTTAGDLEPKVWTINGKLLARITEINSPVTAVSFVDNDLFLTGSKDGTVRLWGLKGDLIKKYEGHTTEIMDLMYDRDTKTIVSSSKNGNVLIQNVPGVTLGELKGYSSTANCLSLDLAKRILYSGHENGEVNAWRLKKLSGYAEDQLVNEIPKSYQESQEIK